MSHNLCLILTKQLITLEITNRTWSSNRRSFIKGLLAAGITSQLGFFQACTENLEKLDQLDTFFFLEERLTLTSIVDTLFPDNNNGPSVKDLNSMSHIIWSLKDQHYGFNNYEMFKNAIQKLNDLTIEEHKGRFEDLDVTHKNDILKKVAKLSWGEDFLGRTLNYIFESLSIDPIYNVNQNSVGWDWLNHQAGYPRPEESQKYPNFLNKFQDDI